MSQMPRKQFCTFRLGEFFFGIDILQVQEIIRRLSFTRIPLAPTMIEGLVNLRGQIVTAIDLRLRLELPPRSADKSPTHVVINTADGATSLMVDEIGDMMELSDDTFELPPDTIQGIARELITGVYKLEHGLLLILDTTKVVQLDAKLFG
jgi:purine-binding chemotaxis protein CheW